MMITTTMIFLLISRGEKNRNSRTRSAKKKGVGNKKGYNVPRVI